MREEHSFIGVYSFATKSLLFLDPSMNLDVEPVWSPDSEAIAFLRLPISRDALLFEPQREGPPWSIRVSRITGGSSSEVWKAPTARGSVYREIVAANQLFWGYGDRLVFPWEGDGWTHLYSISVHGGTPTLLTPGAFEVEFASLSPDCKTVVYSSNQDDIDRRHVWKVAVDGNRPVSLTSGSGIETAPAVSSDNRTVAVLRSDAQIPMRPAIVPPQSEIRDLVPAALPADFPADRMVTPQPVVFTGADAAIPIHAQLFLPPNAKNGKLHPAVVFFHGGSRRQMLLGWHYMPYYSNAYALNQYLASRGYIVLSVNYRSGIGYGLDFREALNYGAAGASELNDSEGAGLYLRSRGDVDPKGIGAWGGSCGGYMTALSLARASDIYAAGVDLHGVHDFNQQIKTYMPSYDPVARPDAARLAWESSPLFWVKDWKSPVLLIMGDDDRDVPFTEMTHLAEALRNRGVSFEQLIIPDELHLFLLHRTWIAVYSAAADFFDRHLAAHDESASTTH